MRRLKPDPVPPELIRKILEAGTAAPSGGNMQRWRFLVVTDPNVKQTVGTYISAPGTRLFVMEDGAVSRDRHRPATCS
jgi:nitroreductase